MGEVGRAAGEGEAGCRSSSSRCVVLQLPLNDPDFDLEKAVCSHGLFMMAPTRWDPATKSLLRPLRLASSSSLPVRVSHPSPSSPLLVSVFGAASLSSRDQQSILAQVRRMLRISDETDRAIREFHKVHAGARETRFGRVFRSPSLFEDMVKCILLCNCQWPRTLSMASALCEFQLELKCCKTPEDFQPKTPQKIELKRKRGKEMKVVVNLETQFVENKTKVSKNADLVTSHDSQLQGLQAEEVFPSMYSCIGEANNSINSSELSALTTKESSLCAHNFLENISFPSYQLGDFPSPEELATVDADYLAKRCKLGYRAQRIISLAQNIVENKIQLRQLEEDSDQSTFSNYVELDKQLSAISGFGPFTRANVLMCMGFYHRIPADTETIRHLKQFHGRSSCTIHSVEKNIESIYGEHAPFQFLAYWFEIWSDYEKRFGKTSEMSPSDYLLITASNMKSKASNQRKVG